MPDYEGPHRPNSVLLVKWGSAVATDEQGPLLCLTQDLGAFLSKNTRVLSKQSHRVTSREGNSVGDDGAPCWRVLL